MNTLFVGWQLFKLSRPNVQGKKFAYHSSSFHTIFCVLEFTTQDSHSCIVTPPLLSLMKLLDSDWDLTERSTTVRLLDLRTRAAFYCKTTRWSCLELPERNISICPRLLHHGYVRVFLLWINVNLRVTAVTQPQAWCSSQAIISTKPYPGYDFATKVE